MNSISEIEETDHRESTSAQTNEHAVAGGDFPLHYEELDIPEPRISEAKMCVLVIRNARYFNRNEHEQWLLRHMFQPLSSDDYGPVEVFYISNTRVSAWQSTPRSTPGHPTKSASLPASSKAPTFAPLFDDSHSTPAVTPKQPPSSTPVSLRSKQNSISYRLTPQTMVHTIAQKYRIVFLLDVSSSLATLDDFSNNVLVGDVLDVLQKCLDGLSRPFVGPYWSGDHPHFDPELHVTILASCSQFSFDTNIASILSGFPTLKPLLQDIVVTPRNLRSVVARARSEFQQIQIEMVTFLRALRKHRKDSEINEENLDSHNTVISPTEVNSHIPIDPRDTANILAQVKPTATTAVKEKTSWGVGLTGSNLTYHLNAGLLALHLMPEDGMPCLCFVTDGVVESNFQDDGEVVRALTREGVTVNIVQVGGEKGSMPSSNFGFVTDNEILRFLCAATGGKFMYAADLTAIGPLAYGSGNMNNWSSDNSRQSSVNQHVNNIGDAGSILLSSSTTDQAAFSPNSSTGSQSGLEKTPIPSGIQQQQQAQQIWNPSALAAIPSLPNFYHKAFLIRDVYYHRLRNEPPRFPTVLLGNQRPVDMTMERPIPNQGLLRPQQTKSHHFRHQQGPLKPFSNFPWDPNSNPPAVETKSIHYLDYPLAHDIGYTIAARLRQGFQVSTVQITKNEVDLPNRPKTDHIRISLILMWLPNVNVEYIISGLWEPPSDMIENGIMDHNKTGGFGINDKNFSQIRGPRAEVCISSYVAFAQLFANIATRKSHPATANLGRPLIGRVIKLDKFLTNIFETDKMLRVNKFSNPFKSSVRTSAIDQASHAIQKNIEIFSSAWDSIEKNEFRPPTRCWYDIVTLDILPTRISPFMAQRSADSEIHQIVEAAHGYLRHNWAHISPREGVFIKILHLRRASTNGSSDGDFEQFWDESNDKDKLPFGFCEARFRRETGCLFTIRLLFFNTSLQLRRKIVDDLKTQLSRIELSDRGSQLTEPKALDALRRPLSYMLMRDEAHFVAPESASSTLDQAQPIVAPLVPLRFGRPWFVTAQEIVASELIVRNYLRHASWEWITENSNESYYTEVKIMPPQDLAYQFLCGARMEQGFKLVASYQNSSHFYFELTVDGSPPCAVQYYIWKDLTSAKLVTQLWMEPNSDEKLRDQYESMKDRTNKADKLIMSHLVSFDEIHRIGRTCSGGLGIISWQGKSRVSESVETTRLLEIAAVMKLAQFLISAYPLPRFAGKLANFTTETRRTNNLSDSEASLNPRSVESSISQPPDSSHYTGSTRQGTSVEISTPYRPPGRSHKRAISKSSPLSSPATMISRATNVTSKVDESPQTIPVDNSFAEYRQSIGKLDAADQDCALLHYFLEQSVNKIMDDEISMIHHDLKDSFWTEFKNSIISSVAEIVSPSGLFLATCLPKTQCFVKILNPESFLLLLLPSVSVVIDLLGSSESTEASRRVLDKWTVAMFECVRPKPLYGPSSSTESINHESFLAFNRTANGQVIINTIPLSLEMTDSNFTTIFQSATLQGHFQAVQNSHELSIETMHVSRALTRSYARGFVKTMYASVLQRRIVDSLDFDKVLRVCGESYMEIDITEFVNVQILLSKTGTAIDHSGFKEIDSRFIAALGYYFEPLVDTEGRHRGTYYYRPPPPQGMVSGRQEPVDVMSHIIDSAQKPLFMRLQCIFEKPSVSQKITIPIARLPTSYTGDLNGEAYNLEPEKIGNNASPVKSADDTVATLCLVYMTLPFGTDEIENSSLSDISSLGGDTPKSNAGTSTTTEALKLKSTSFHLLASDKQVALQETEDRLNWLLTEEVMHGLLRVRPITEQILRYIENQLKKKNSFVDFPTSISIPLQFVRKSSYCHPIFIEELAMAKFTPFTLNKVGDYFYVSEDEPDVSTTSDPTSSELENSDLEGLGISVSETPDDSGERRQKVVQKQLYWLLLIPQKRYIQLCFYSKLVPASVRSSIITTIRGHVLRILNRTNQIALLNLMNETRLCSKYLVPLEGDLGIGQDSGESSGEEMEQDEREEGDDFDDGNLTTMRSSSTDYNNVPTKKFTPGQFACNRVYAQKFPLHWRLKSNDALKGVTLALSSFAVRRRRYMLVFKEDKSVFYAVFSEVGSQNVPQDAYEHLDEPSRSLGPQFPFISKERSTTSLAQLSFSMPYTTAIAGGPDSNSSPSSVNTSPRHSSITSPEFRKIGAYAKAPESRELCLEVYGVDEPSIPFIESLSTQVGSILTSDIMLKMMSMFLTRNSALKMTAADINFILPINKPPVLTKTIHIPQLVSNPYKFMLYLRQNIQEYVKQLTGPHVTDAIEDHYVSLYGMSMGSRDDEQDSNKGSSQDTYPGFCFYYNCAPSKHLTHIESAVGEGLAGICFTVLNSSGKPASRIAADELPTTEFIDMSLVEQCLKMGFVDVTQETAGSTYSLQIELWIVGSINAKVLLAQLEKSLYQSLCNYLLEINIATEIHSIKENESHVSSETTNISETTDLLDDGALSMFVDSSFAILKQAVEIRNPSVQAKDFSIELPPSKIDEFLVELSDFLIDMNALLEPIVLKAAPSEVEDTTNINNAKYRIYHPSHYQRTQVPPDLRYRYILISGVKEFLDSSMTTINAPRRKSIDSGRSHRSTGVNSRRSSVDGSQYREEVSAEPIARKDSISMISSEGQNPMEFVMLNSNLAFLNAQSIRPSQKPELDRRCLLIMSLDQSLFSLYIYNWKKAYSDKIFELVQHAADWHFSRNSILHSILHQKMGLFHHGEDIIKMSLLPSSLTQQSQRSTMTQRSLQSSGPNIPSSSSNLNLRNSESEGFPHHRIPSGSISAGSGPDTTLFDLSSLKSLVNESFPSRLRHSNVSFEEVHRPSFEVRPRRDETSSVFSAETDRQLKGIGSLLPISNLSKGAVNINDVLRNAFAESVDRYPDPLMRHGYSFLETYTRQARLARAHENALKAYQKWTKSYQDTKNKEESISSSDLNMILRSARLLHFCRTPIKLVEFEATADEELNLPMSASLRADIEQWCRSIVKTFMKSYTEYLESLRMHTVDFDIYKDTDQPSNSSISNLKASKDLMAELCQPAYMLIAFQGGSIMSEVCIQGTHASVTLYTLNRRYGRLQIPSSEFEKEDGRESFKQFTEECGNFKKLVHVNSFVYDFHLRYIQATLDNRTKIPSNFDMLGTIKGFVKNSVMQPMYARNRIVESVLHLDDESIPESLFDYILRNIQKYGFNTIVSNERLVACYISSDTCNFASSPRLTAQSTSPSFRYTLLAYQGEHCVSEQRKGILLHYIIIITHKSSVYQPSRTRRMVGEDLGESEQSNPLDEILVPETHSLRTVIENGKSLLKFVVEKAVALYDRDSLWRMLQSGQLESSNIESIAVLFVQLRDHFEPLDICVVEPTFVDLFSLPIRWSDAFDLLMNVYITDAREFQEPSVRHLVLFNPADSSFLIHLHLCENGNICGSVVSKEKREVEDQPTILEVDYVGDIVKTIGYFLWKQPM